MTTTQQSIMKAVEGGWDAQGLEFDIYSTDGKTKHSDRHYSIHAARQVAEALKYDAIIVPYEPACNSWMFDHGFARSFFGEGLGDSFSGGYGMVSWKYHLQQLALETDRDAYLARFL